MSHLALDVVLLLNVTLFVVNVFHMFLHSSFPISSRYNWIFICREGKDKVDGQNTGLAFTRVCCVVCGMRGIEGARLTSEQLEFRPYLACQEPVFGSAGAQTLLPLFHPAEQLH